MWYAEQLAGGLGVDQRRAHEWQIGQTQRQRFPSRASVAASLPYPTPFICEAACDGGRGAVASLAHA
jgi:hypothetical protein